jgi:uncharacterized membrane protein YedE/YeeE
MWELSIGASGALVGLFGGIVLGFAARMGDFCTLGAIESAAYGGDQTRARLWGIVLGTSVIGVFFLNALGLATITDSIYLSIAWNPLASILGGLVFGYGMALAGNCGFGALIRMGGGDLRAFLVVMIMAIAGFVTLAGPLAHIRVAMFPQEPASTAQGMAHALSGLTGLPLMVIALVVGAAFFAVGLSYEPLRRKPKTMLWGVLAGVALVWAFAGTSWLRDVTMGAVPVEGFTFTAPLGRTVLWLMTSTAGGLNFAVGSVTGVIFGAAAAAIWRKRFKWEACEDPRELGRQVLGAVLMGIGGVVALGCSIGQGASAFSVLAFSAPVTVVAIIAGALFGLRQLVRGFQSI